MQLSYKKNNLLTNDAETQMNKQGAEGPRNLENVS